MVDFKEALNEVQQAKQYISFLQKHPDFYLAHGFVHLDKNFAVSKKWQIGLYSPKKDKLAVFNTKPVLLNPLEDAFKDGGIIDPLEQIDKLVPTEDILNIVREELKKEEYAKEIATSFIVILHALKKIPTYNITVVTSAFNIINIKIDALSKEIISLQKDSILSLEDQKYAKE